MYHVTKLLRRLEAATQPFEGVLNNKNVFIKTPNGTWGNKVLINEFVCLKLAESLNIPIPNGGICIIDENTDINEVVDYIDYSEEITGVCFFSERLEKSLPIVNSLSVLSNIENKSDINKIALFDHIIYNEDRHQGNILLQHSVSMGHLLMYVIDHSHVFNLKHSWNAEKLEKLIFEEDFKDITIMKLNNYELYKNFFDSNVLNANSLNEQSNLFKEIITEDLLDNILKDIPKEWISNEEDLKALKKYILYRVDNIEYMVQLILDYNGGV